MDSSRQASLWSNFERRQACRKQYRALIRQCGKDAELSYTNDLHEALMQNKGTTFWKIWKSKFENKKKCNEVEGLVNNQDIAEKFAEFFKSCYTANNVERAAELEAEYKLSRQTYSGFPMPENSSFNVEMISKIIADMESGKAPGLDGLTAEHLVYAHPSVVVILSKLFELIVAHCIIPDGFRYNYIVPLPKVNSRSKSMRCNDFRGIAISPVILKIFEHCFLKRFSNFLTSSDNQFGFKKHHGCGHAVYTARKIVEHIIQGDGTANLCSIDLTKAFDKVNHNALFIKLMKRNIPLKLLQLLEMLLANCFSTVKWLGTYSCFFPNYVWCAPGICLSSIFICRACR